MTNDKTNDVLSIEKAERYLSNYSVFRRCLEMNIYEKNYFEKSKKMLDPEGLDLSLPGSETDLRIQMFEIRRFVLSLGNCNEKLFLFYHYIHGEPVERCAELINISRRSAFRLKLRALSLASKKLDFYLENREKGVR